MTKKNNVTIYIGSAFLVFAGLGLFLWISARNGHLDFIGKFQLIAALLLIISGVLTWFAIVLMVTPTKKVKVDKNQIISLIFSIAISVFWWGRYSFASLGIVEQSKESS